MTAPSSVTNGTFNLAASFTSALYGYKLSGTGGPGYVLLGSTSPGDGVLTGAQVSSVASSLQTYLAGISGVSSAVQSQITLTGTPTHFQWNYGAGPGLLPTVQVDGTWSIYGYDAHKSPGVDALVWLCTSSPGDGMLSSTIVQGIASEVNSLLAAISGVVSVTQDSVPTLSGVPS